MNHSRRELVRLIRTLEAQESMLADFEGLSTREIVGVLRRRLAFDICLGLSVLVSRMRIVAGAVKRRVIRR